MRSQQNIAMANLMAAVNLNKHINIWNIQIYLWCKSVMSKVDDFATFKKVEVHAENSTS